MRFSRLLMPGILIVIAGCSSGGGGNSGANVAEDNLRRIADCAAKTDAYASVASDAMSSGRGGSAAAGATMESIEATGKLRQLAEQMERSMPPTGGETRTARIMRETQAALQTEKQNRGDYGYATYLGNEASRCSALVQ